MVGDSLPDEIIMPSFLVLAYCEPIFSSTSIFTILNFQIRAPKITDQHKKQIKKWHLPLIEKTLHKE